jgi:hypothetical protein
VIGAASAVGAAVPVRPAEGEVAAPGDEVPGPDGVVPGPIGVAGAVEAGDWQDPATSITATSIAARARIRSHSWDA